MASPKQIDNEARKFKSTASTYPADLPTLRVGKSMTLNLYQGSGIITLELPMGFTQKSKTYTHENGERWKRFVITCTMPTESVRVKASLRTENSFSVGWVWYLKGVK